jgi:hypothetical protein
VVLLALYPWVEVKSDSSPFVMIFHHLDSNLVASAPSEVIIPESSREFTGTPRLLTRARNVGALPCTDRAGALPVGGGQIRQ